MTHTPHDDDDFRWISLAAATRNMVLLLEMKLAAASLPGSEGDKVEATADLRGQDSADADESEMVSGAVIMNNSQRQAQQR